MTEARNAAKRTGICQILAYIRLSLIAYLRSFYALGGIELKVYDIWLRRVKLEGSYKRHERSLTSSTTPLPKRLNNRLYIRFEVACKALAVCLDHIEAQSEVINDGVNTLQAQSDFPLAESRFIYAQNKKIFAKDDKLDNSLNRPAKKVRLQVQVHD
jgi:hypothetical protein